MVGGGCAGERKGGGGCLSFFRGGKFCFWRRYERALKDVLTEEKREGKERCFSPHSPTEGSHSLLTETDCFGGVG